MIHNRLKFTSLLLVSTWLRGSVLDWRLSQPGFDRSFRHLVCLATPMSSDRTKQICLWMTIYIYIYIYTHTYVFTHTFTTPFARTGYYDTSSIFKQSLPSPRLVALSKQKSPVCSTHKIVGLILFPKELALYEIATPRLGFELWSPCPFLKTITSCIDKILPYYWYKFSFRYSFNVHFINGQFHIHDTVLLVPHSYIFVSGFVEFS